MPKGMQDNPLEKRLRRTMEGLYENEALTSDLDDDAANVLLKWAADRVEQIVRSTEEMDDTQAEEAMYPRMRALRKMSRYINRIARGGGDPAQLVEKVVAQAKEVYGDSIVEADLEKLQLIARMPQSEPGMLLQAIRQLFEGDMHGEEEKLDE